MIIPFNIKYRKEIESGEYKVVTIDNNPVTILKWDVRGTAYPIVACVEVKDGDETIDFVNTFSEDGEISDSDNVLLKLQVPDIESTEFEDALIALAIEVNCMNPVKFTNIAKVWARQNADKLIDLAKKETVWVHNSGSTVTSEDGVEDDDYKKNNTIKFDITELS